MLAEASPLVPADATSTTDPPPPSQSPLADPNVAKADADSDVQMLDVTATTSLPTPIPTPTTSTTVPAPSPLPDTPSKDKEETCPACSTSTGTKKKTSKTTHWVECERCGGWYHWDCVGGKGEALGLVDKWYCQGCLGSDSELRITFKAPARKSTRKRLLPDSSSSLSSSPSTSLWKKFITTKPLAADKFKRMRGEEVTLDWVLHDEGAMREPVVVEDPRGLGMRMPGWKDGVEGVGVGEFGVDDVARIVGLDTPVEVIDVATQSNSPSWDLRKWSEYYRTPAAQRDKIRNVISLEVSCTPLAPMLNPPKLVRDIDWFHAFWPAGKRGPGKGAAWPKVQLYCLMSVEDCWTDMHVDFAGSSVFYHVLRGAKTFYFIRPTKANLLAYEKWCGSEAQSSTWLGDFVDEVVKVELKQGNTMFIPTGWIHAVYTPVDSLVFGGNFLHSYNISTQLRVRDIEIKTRVPKKFRFPLFQRMCWYVGEGYNAKLRAKESIPPRVLHELKSLSDFLMSEARLIEGSAASTERKEARDMVPHDKVSDASALARELRWRLRVALGAGSDDEEKERKKQPVLNGKVAKRSTPTVANGLAAKKRKRSESDADDDEDARSIFRNFTPTPWSAVRKSEAKVERLPAQVVPDDVAKDLGVGGGARGELERRTDTVVKLRETRGSKGEVILQREVVTRVRESWRPC